MAKRFTGTEKWVDPWFRKLSQDHKLFWSFINENCDVAGVWNPDLDLAEFQIGGQLDPEEVLEAMGGRVVVLENGKWFITGFVEFQQAKGLSPRSPIHQKIIGILEENSVKLEEGPNGFLFVSKPKTQDTHDNGYRKGSDRVSDTHANGFRYSASSRSSSSNSSSSSCSSRARACEAEDLNLLPDPPAPKRNLDREAEAVYAEYPLKVGKPVALRAIKKQLAKFPFEELLAKTKVYAEARAGDKEFISHPSTWFNQQRFNDDPSTWTRSEPTQDKPKPNLLDADTYV